ncbi:MAG: hypothetical protein ACE3JR_13650 [Ectobacillus sp.]
MSADWHPFSNMVCGSPDDDVLETQHILKHLGNTINRFTNRLLSLNLLEEDQRELAPFYARSIMEAAGTALVARMDPFRILSIYKVQSASSYDVTKKSNVALQWTGDILAANTPKKNIWHPDIKFIEYDRALLSNHNAELFWKPGFLRVLDYMSPGEEATLRGEWINQLLSQDEEQYFERSKTEAGKLYSAFSKGIHYEFLVNAESVYDATTVQSYIIRMFQLFSNLGLVSHFIGITSSKLDNASCLEQFIQIEELVKEWRQTMVS